jgi:hypothetical protein
VVDGEIVELGHAWIKQEQGEIWAMAASLRAREREQQDGEVDCNLHPRRRRSTPVALALRRWFLLI